MSRQFNASGSASEDMVSFYADRVGGFDLLVSCRAVKITHSNHGVLMLSNSTSAVKNVEHVSPSIFDPVLYNISSLT